MKRIFFIDKENVGNRFIEGLDELTSQDRLIVFHWKEAGDINPEVLKKLANTKAAVEIVKFKTHTKNALDFQICTYMGVLYGKYGCNAQYYIVSNDNGYTAAMEFLKALDSRIHVEKVPNCAINSKSVDELLLGKLLDGSYNSKVKRAVRQCIHKSADLNGFHTSLQQTLKRDYHDIYMKISPMYSELKAYC